MWGLICLLDGTVATSQARRNIYYEDGGDSFLEPVFCKKRQNLVPDQLLKPDQNKKGQNFFQQHRFLNTFYSWQLRKSIQKTVQLENFRPYLFWTDFSKFQDQSDRIVFMLNSRLVIFTIVVIMNL